MILLCGGSAAAQDRWSDFATPIFRTIGAEQGLLNPVATALGEDADGFLWVGTQGGLARWDGYRLRTYRPDPDVPGSLPDAWITAIHTDPHGTLWIGTTAGGLARYDRDHDRFVVYGAGPHGLSNVSVAALADDGDGGLWIGTGGGLDHLDPASGRITTLRHDPSDPASLPDDHVDALLRDDGGMLWVGTKGGLAHRAAGSDGFVAVPFGAASSEAVAIAALFQGADRRVWIGTVKHGAFVTSEAGAIPKPLSELAQNNLGPSDEWVFAIGAGDGDEVWFGTYGGGIVAIDGVTGYAHRILNQTPVPRSLPSDTIYALYKDRAGGVWVASQGGLSRLQSADAAVVTVFGGVTDPRSLSGVDILATLATRDGRVWLGLVNAGIDIVDPVLGRVATLAPNLGLPGPAPRNRRVTALAQGPDDTVFIGTYNGVFRADPDGSHVAPLPIPGRDPVSRSHALLAAGDRLWVGGGDDGLWSFVPGDPAPAEHLDADTLTDRRVSTLLPGRDGDLWIGTRHGLNRLDLASRTVRRMLPDPADPNSLPVGYVSTLMLDRAGRLWVGTMGGGIAILVGEEGGRPMFRRLSAKQGLPDQNVDSLLMDAAGRIWAATDDGIAVIDPDDLSVHALQPADGVAMPTYWAHSAAATARGEMLFGGATGGLTVIRPERFRPQAYQPPVVVDDVRVGGATLPLTNLNAGGGAQLVVRPGADSVAVEFSALDYAAAEKIRYAYRLEGFDRGWTETDATRRVAAYTNLPPGDYVLRVRGTDRDGRWSETTLDLRVLVLPAWYQTWLFYAGAGLLAAMVVVGLVQGRTRYLRLRQRELELLVAERTAELEERKREIEQIAYHDALTGLPNRRMFIEQINAMLASTRSEGRRFALLLIDLDGFKHINDTLGHDAGDALLAVAASRLLAAIRVSDSVARLGGDEFTVLLSDLPGGLADDRDVVDAVCARIVESLLDPISFKGIEMRTSASVGATLCPKDGTSQEMLYKAADRALYEAKRGGRATWRWHDASLDAPVG